MNMSKEDETMHLVQEARLKLLALVFLLLNPFACWLLFPWDVLPPHP